MKRLLVLALAVAGAWSGLSAQDGFAAKVTGGAGGRTVPAGNVDELRAYAGSEEPLVIEIRGAFSIGMINVRSNKSLIGVGKGVELTGTLMIGNGARNVIVRNLTLTNPMNKKGKGGGDGITVRGGKEVWIDHCTFRDCGDGCVDITEGADVVTVSWCKFFYTKQPKHRFTMLVKGRDKKKYKNQVKLTLHHNWWADHCDQRMPAAFKARVHMYNNYFSCSGNSYCTNSRKYAEVFNENNFYEGVRNPIFVKDGGELKVRGVIFKNCTGHQERGNDGVFTPPYDYKLQKTQDVPAIVKAGAGAQ